MGKNLKKWKGMDLQTAEEKQHAAREYEMKEFEKKMKKAAKQL